MKLKFVLSSLLLLSLMSCVTSSYEYFINKKGSGQMIRSYDLKGVAKQLKDLAEPIKSIDSTINSTINSRPLNGVDFIGFETEGMGEDFESQGMGEDDDQLDNKRPRKIIFKSEMDSLYDLMLKQIKMVGPSSPIGNTTFYGVSKQSETEIIVDLNLFSEEVRKLKPNKYEKFSDFFLKSKLHSILDSLNEEMKIEVRSKFDTWAQIDTLNVAYDSLIAMTKLHDPEEVDFGRMQKLEFNQVEKYIKTEELGLSNNLLVEDMRKAIFEVEDKKLQDFMIGFFGLNNISITYNLPEPIKNVSGDVQWEAIGVNVVKVKIDALKALQTKVLPSYKINW